MSRVIAWCGGDWFGGIDNPFNSLDVLGSSGNVVSVGMVALLEETISNVVGLESVFRGKTLPPCPYSCFGKCDFGMYVVVL